MSSKTTLSDQLRPLAPCYARYVIVHNDVIHMAHAGMPDCSLTRYWIGGVVDRAKKATGESVSGRKTWIASMKKCLPCLRPGMLT